MRVDLHDLDKVAGFAGGRHNLEPSGCISEKDAGRFDVEDVAAVFDQGLQEVDDVVPDNECVREGGEGVDELLFTGASVHGASSIPFWSVVNSTRP